MSSNRSTFRRLTPDRRPIRLGDGKVINWQGLGSTAFLSDSSVIITIADVLFVPDLSVNLFAAHKFIWAHRDSHLEVTEYPKRKWTNRQTGTVEFTAMIRTNGLAYLDWKVTPRNESVNVSMEELHAQSNHLPFSADRPLMHSRSLDGVPARVTDSRPRSRFCEDCPMESSPDHPTPFPPHALRHHCSGCIPMYTAPCLPGVDVGMCIGSHSSMSIPDSLLSISLGINRASSVSSNGTRCGRRMSLGGSSAYCVMIMVQSTPRPSSISF